ncbi:MAG: CapA family protein, partial [Clostridiales bacterium]|nr:CapA family protein [Clostridiales bacterium]
MNKENRSRIIRVVVGIAIILAALGTSIAMRLPDRLANKDDTPIKLEETVTKEAEPVQTKTEEPVMSLSTEKKNKEKQEIKQEENNTEPEAKPEFVLPIEGKVSIETYNDLPPLPEIEINLCAIGDIMAHDGTIASARRGNTYDFTAMLQEVSPYMADADYIVGNLETTFAGASKGYTGYPLFNTPEQMANGLRNVLGMDLLSTANNHSLDKGYDGLVSTLKFLEEYGIDHVGTYRSKDEQNTPFITEINGVKVAFLSYTYASNQPIPSKRGYCINIIDKSRIKDEAARAKEAGAEYIIVLLHWGVEYQRYASKSQRYLSEWIFENTYTDLIIGNHAHVVAPI